MTLNYYEQKPPNSASVHPSTQPNTSLEKINQKFLTNFVRIKTSTGRRNYSDTKTSTSFGIAKIEAFISSKVLPGKIWKTATENEIVTFYVKNFHFCEKIGRPHTSKNQIFFKFYPSSDTLKQCCFSLRCKMLPDKIVVVDG